MEKLDQLTTALLMVGLAMQMVCSSRPVSGAEHQFSHLWDMQHHTYCGEAPSHGFKVGIGSLASVQLYEFLDRSSVEDLKVEDVVASWPTLQENEREIDQLFKIEDLVLKAKYESNLKHIDSEQLRKQLKQLQLVWPSLAAKIKRQLIPFSQMQDMLSAVGCPTTPQQIGIEPERLRSSYRQAYHIRRRYTLLDCVRRLGLLDKALENIFLQHV